MDKPVDQSPDSLHKTSGFYSPEKSNMQAESFPSSHLYGTFAFIHIIHIPYYEYYIIRYMLKMLVYKG